MAKSNGGGSSVVTDEKKSSRSIPKGKTQVNFNIPDPTLEKVKSLGRIEGVTNSDIYNLAVEKFIELYEKKHGKIKASPKGKGLDL